MDNIGAWAGDDLWLPEAVAWARLGEFAKRINDARFQSAVGDDTRQRIEHTMQDVGLSMSDRWLFVETSRHERDGGGINGRLVVPAHLAGRPGMFPFAFSTAYPWDKQYRRYTFELFGRMPASPEEAATCPAGWTLKVEDEPGFEGPQFVHLMVYRARVIHSTAQVYGRADWRPGWPKVEYSYGGVVLGKDNDTTAADKGLRLLRGIALSDAKRVLQGRIAIANAELRRSHRHTAQKRATVEQLAKAAGYARTYLPDLARRLGVDLEPYLALTGLPPFDPTRDPETSDKI